MTKKHSPLVLFSLFFTFFQFAVNAQDSIVLTNGTGFSGLIKNKGWVKTPEQILFEKEGERFEYGPNELKEFYVNGDKYISRTVDINITNQNIQGLKTSTQQEIVTRHIFLRVLVEGQANLYSYRLVRTHFFTSQGNGFLELTKLKTNSGGTVDRYVGQLKVLWKDCSEDLKIEKIRFTSSSLAKAFERYNLCVSDGSTYVVKKNPIRKGLFLVAGYKFVDYDLSGSGFYSNFTFKDPNNGTLNFGIGFELSPLNNSDRFQIYNDLLYQPITFEAEYRDFTSNDQFVDYDLKVDVSYLILTNLVRYNFRDDLKKFTFYLNGGLTQAFLISDNSTERSNSVFFGRETMRDRQPLAGEIKTYTLSGVLGAGFRKDRLSLEARYIFKPEPSSFPNLSNAESINLLLSYKIL